MALQDNALVTLLQAQEALQRQGVDTTGQDDYIESLINGVSDDFEQYCNRSFHEQIITGYELKGTDRQFINLPITPVTSVQKVVFNDVELDTKSNDEFGGYYIHTDQNGVLGGSGKIGRQIGWWSRGYVNNALEFSKDPDRRTINIVIDYTGGYADIPQNLQNACLTELTRMYNYEADGYKEYLQEKVQHVSVSAIKGDINEDTGWSRRTMNTLSKYKRVVLV